jgi:hydroxymethylglutaryl-CoA synthase
MIGIRYYGAYVPRYRLDRKKIFESMGWLNSGTIALSKGEKAIANFDEDAITMSVAASINAIESGKLDRNDLNGVYFGSTTMPFQERQNAGIIATALGMGDHVRSVDFSGSLKSGTSALIAALEAVKSGGATNMVACTSDCRLGKMGSPQEMLFGDAAAAFIVSDQDVIAEYKGSISITGDFGDHVRGRYSKFDRQWEDRWIRDAGYDKLIPQAVKSLLDKFDLEIGEFSKIIYSCHYAAARKKLNQDLSIETNKVQDIYLNEIGDMGSAQSLVMLAGALETAKPGDKIMVVSFGSGCDALYFEVTDKINDLKNVKAVSSNLAKRANLDQYSKYLAWRHIVPIDTGIRGEEDLSSRWSFMWRYSKAILGFCGTKCKKCGTPQFPPQRVCVKPSCGAIDDMEDYNFSPKKGKIGSFTGDQLAASLNPPQIYGNIFIEGGGKVMMNFTDCDLETLKVGMPLYFSFRIKYFDERRDIYRYFWKAIPIIKEG